MQNRLYNRLNAGLTRLYNTYTRHSLLSQYQGNRTIDIPKTICVVINNVCNLKCSMCDIGTGDFDSHMYKELELNEKQSMNFDTFRALLDSVSNRRKKPTLFFVLSEPLLHREIGKFIEYSKERGFKISMTTNGTMISKKIDCLVSGNIESLNISIHGHAELHNKIVGVKGAHQRIIEGIELLDEAKKRQKTKHPEIIVNCVIGPENYSHLHSIVADITKQKIDWLWLSHLNFVTGNMVNSHNHLIPEYPIQGSFTGDYKPGTTIDTEILKEQIQKIQHDNFDTSITFYPWLSLGEIDDYYNTPENVVKGFNRCDQAWRFPLIHMNGDVRSFYRCCSPLFGNINQQTLMEAWTSKYAHDFRDKLREHGTFPCCTRCGPLFSSFVSDRIPVMEKYHRKQN